MRQPVKFVKYLSHIENIFDSTLYNDAMASGATLQQNGLVWFLKSRNAYHNKFMEKEIAKMGPKSKCKFNEKWLLTSDPNGDKYSDYVQPVKDDQHRAKCSICNDSITISWQVRNRIQNANCEVNIT